MGSETSGSRFVSTIITASPMRDHSVDTPGAPPPKPNAIPAPGGSAAAGVAPAPGGRRSGRSPSATHPAHARLQSLPDRSARSNASRSAAVE